MKHLIIISAVVCGGFIFTACGGENTQQSNVASVAYTCEMHPEVHSDKPDKCPKCGMDLMIENTSVGDSSTITNPVKDSISNH